MNSVLLQQQMDLNTGYKQRNTEENLMQNWSHFHSLLNISIKWSMFLKSSSNIHKITVPPTVALDREIFR